MAPSNDNDESREASESGANVFGRLRNPGAGTTEFEDREDEAVDKVGDRLRQEREIEGQGRALSEQSIEQQDVGADEFEEVVLDALGPDGTEGAGAPAAERDTDTGIGNAEAPDPSISQTDSGTGAAVDAKVDFDPDDESGANAAAEIEDGDTEEAGQVCPSCESVSPPGMRFCVQCGASLREEQEEEAEADDEPERVHQTLEESQPTFDRDKLDSQLPGGLELVAINDDGSDGRAIPIQAAETILGRDGDTRFPTDEFLNPEHARLTLEDGDFYIEDLRSLNGTFLKLRGEVRLRPGDTFLMGRQVLRFEKIEQDFDSKKTAADGTRYMGSPAPGGDYKILQIGVGDIVQNIYCLPDSGVVLGREKGDVIFKDDKFMSGRHARIFTDDEPHLADLNSSNGTWIKIWEKTQLKQDDCIFMGQQLFRVELPD